MVPKSKFVGHSSEIIQQSKIKGPLHRDWCVYIMELSSKTKNFSLKLVWQKKDIWKLGHPFMQKNLDRKFHTEKHLICWKDKWNQKHCLSSLMSKWSLFDYSNFGKLWSNFFVKNHFWKTKGDPKSRNCHSKIW